MYDAVKLDAILRRYIRFIKVVQIRHSLVSIEKI